MQNIDSYLFMLKKFLGGLLMPVPLILLLLIWAALMLLRKKTRWSGAMFALLATALLFVGSYAPITNKITGPLEQQYPSYQVAAEPADYVAVLGHSHVSSDTQPITSQLTPTGVVRVTEGIRIYRLNPGSKLVFTGYSAGNPVSYAEKSKQLALALGVPETDILTFDGPQDTGEEASLLAANFADKKLVLVTTASHMPRAMLLCEAAGINPTPAPTNHQSKPVQNTLLFPSARTLAKAQYWAHEQLGLAWAKLMQQAGKNPAKSLQVQRQQPPQKTEPTSETAPETTEK